MLKRQTVIFSLLLSIVLVFWVVLSGNTRQNNTPPNRFSPKLSQSDTPTDSFMVGGIQMNEGYLENWTKTVKKVGMNTIEVTVYAYHGRWMDNNLWFYDYVPGVIEEIRFAKQQGLKVVLILRLQMDHEFPENRFLWHGMVCPDSEYLLQRWFEEYTRFAKKWAIVAGKEGVEVLVLGSEMNALFDTRPVESVPMLEEYFLNPLKQKIYRNRMLKNKNRIGREHLHVFKAPPYKSLERWLRDREAIKKSWAKRMAMVDSTNQIEAINKRREVKWFYWNRLIDDVRAAYKGKLTVAANFDNYQEVAFWHKLDYIGINAYFPLRKFTEDKNPAKTIRKNWEKVLKQIQAFRSRPDVPDIPVLFTELGYTNLSGSTMAPWQGSGLSLLEHGTKDSLVIWKEQPIDHSERNMAVRILYDVVREQSFPLAGILYWKFTTYPHQLEYDHFAVLLDPEVKDSLQPLLLRFKDLKVPSPPESEN